MPIYEYECPVCGRFEVIHKSNDRDLESCPQCKEKGKNSKVTRAISASAFHLKGTGWYKTDYASSSSSGSAPKKKAASSESSDSGSSDTKKEDSAPAKGSCGSGCGCH